MTPTAQSNNDPNLDESKPLAQNLDVSAQWREKIENIRKCYYNFVSPDDGTRYDTFGVMNSENFTRNMLALLTTVQAETDRNSRIAAAGYLPLSSHQPPLTMTGQEWYNRFESEYDEVIYQRELFYGKDMLDAAKRAAGLTDGQ